MPETTAIYSRTTAYHEAGHAVMGWLCGMQPHDVTVIPDEEEETGGKARHHGPGEWGDLGFRIWGGGDQAVVEQEDGTFRKPTPSELEHHTLTGETCEWEPAEQEVMWAAAGEAAHRIIEPGFSGHWGSNRDREDVQGLTDDWPGAVERAQAFLSRPVVWRNVEALAARLLEVGTVRWPEMLAIFRSVVSGTE